MALSAKLVLEAVLGAECSPRAYSPYRSEGPGFLVIAFGTRVQL